MKLCALSPSKNTKGLLWRSQPVCLPVMCYFNLDKQKTQTIQVKKIIWKKFYIQDTKLYRIIKGILYKSKRNSCLIFTTDRLSNWYILKLPFIGNSKFRFIASLFLILTDPPCHVVFLQVARLHDRWRIQRVLMSQVQVMGAIFDQHGNEAVAYALGNPACSPGVKGTVTVTKWKQKLTKLT